MRILHVIPSLSKGGAERIVVELANASNISGDDITILLAYPVDYSLNQQLLEREVKVHFMSSNNLLPQLKYIRLPLWISKNHKFVQSFDVIHCHLTFGLVFGSILSIWRKIHGAKKPKLIATCHMVGLRGRIEWINRAFSYFFDSFVLMALDSRWRKFITSFKRTNIDVVANGISTDKSASSLKRKRVGSPKVIGTISRLEAERRPWQFLEVFSEISKLDSKGEYRFIIGGDGAERKKLEHLAKELNLNDTLIFAGLIENSDNFFSQIDLYVSMNVEGITGIAGLEAVFAGLPVVALQLLPEYSIGESDWIWSSIEPRHVAEKILELTKDTVKTQDLILYQSYYAARHYSTQRMLSEYKIIYES